MRQLVIGYTKICLKEIDYENMSFMELLRLVLVYYYTGLLIHVQFHSLFLMSVMC